MVINRNELLVSPLETKKKECYKINNHEDLLMVPGIVAERIIGMIPTLKYLKVKTSLQLILIRSGSRC